MDDSRRNFLKKTGYATLGAGMSVPLMSATLNASGHGDALPATKQWGMIVDIKKSQNEAVARACMEACRLEHNIPLVDNPKQEVKWIWTENFENLFPDQTHPRLTQHLRGQKTFALCNHCSRPSCVRVCPTQATWKRKKDGIVMMDMHRCIGCRFCMAACPFGARSFNFSDPRKYLGDDITSNYPTRTKGVVEKCNFCAERLRDGRQPACVEAANKTPGGKGTLTFGDVSDPHSEVSKILKEKHTICRRLAMGTGPNVYYLV